MKGRYRVTVLSVELYDPLLIQRAIARAGGDGARTGPTLAIEVPGGFRPAIVASFGSRGEATRLLASLASDGIEAIIVDDGHPLWNGLRRAWLRLEGRDPAAKTTAPEQRPPDQPVDPLAPPGAEPGRNTFKLHRNADRADINPVDAAVGELRIHLVRLAGLIVVILLFALPWYFMLGRVSSSENLKGAGGGEEIFRLSGGSGADLPKGALEGGSGDGSSDGSGGDSQREAEQLAAGAGSGDDGKAGPTRGPGEAGPIDEPNEAGAGGGAKGGNKPAPAGGDPDAANDQLKRTALLLTIAGLLGLVAGLVAGWLSFSRGKPGLRAIKSPWLWVAAAVLVGGLALSHFATRQSELKKVAAKVQQEGSGSGSGSGDPAGSGSGDPTANGSDEAAGSGSGSGAAAPREGSGAAPPKSIAAQVASMQGPPKPNLAALLRTLREKQAPAAKPSRAKAGARAGATRSADKSEPTAPAPSTGPREPSTGPSEPAKATPAPAAPSSASQPAPTPSGPASGPGKGSGRSPGSPASADRAANPPQAAAEQNPATGPEAAAEGNAGASSGTPSAPSAKAPKPGTVEARVASMGEPPCEQQRSPYKAMLCKLRKERTEAAAKAAAEAAAAKPGADPNRPGADKPGADKAPGQPGGGTSKKGNQPPANSQEPPLSPGLVAGVGLSVGFLLGLLLSLFYYRFYRR